MTYEFKGDNKALISSINALLALDAKGALAPHGIGEMARDLLETCAARLPAEQHQGEPVAWFTEDHLTDKSATTWDGAVAGQWRAKGWPVSQLYTHADPGEAEQFPHGSPANKAVFMALESYTGTTTFEQACLQLAEESRAMRVQLAERDALLRDALESHGVMLMSDPPQDPWKTRRIAERINSALSEREKPSEPDELTDLATWKRRAIEAESKLRTYDPQVVELGEQAMQALLANPKPSELVLTKCRLCDQLQADLTARDQQIDALRQGMKGDYDLDAWLAFVEEAPQLRLDAERYRWLRDKAHTADWEFIGGQTPDAGEAEIDAAMAKEVHT